MRWTGEAICIFPRNKDLWCTFPENNLSSIRFKSLVWMSDDFFVEASHFVMECFVQGCICVFCPAGTTTPPPAARKSVSAKRRKSGTRTTALSSARLTYCWIT